MMLSSTFISLTITSLVATATDAFVLPKVGAIHRASYFPVDSALTACLDGTVYEPSQPEPQREPYLNDTCYLSLYHDGTNQHSEEYIVKCITDIVGMEPGDAYDALSQSKQIGGVGFLDEYPVEEAEYYYEQLTAKGIPVIIA